MVPVTAAPRLGQRSHSRRAVLADDAGHHTPPPTLHLAVSWARVTCRQTSALTAETTQTAEPEPEDREGVDCSAILTRAVKTGRGAGDVTVLGLPLNGAPCLGAGLAGRPPCCFCPRGPAHLQMEQDPAPPTAPPTAPWRRARAIVGPSGWKPAERPLLAPPSRL